MTRARRLRVFAVEPEAVQLTWSALGPGEVTVRCGDVVQTVEADGGPGTVDLRGLAPDTEHVIQVGERRLTARTPAPPPGRELFRFMTLSDMHLGSDGFGLVRQMREPGVDEVHTLRGTRAALDEGLAWGAQHLFLKGDAVDHGAEEEYELLGKVLAEAGLPTDAVPGNHEAKPYRQVDHTVAFDALGLTPVEDGLRTVDLPGLRVVLVDTTTAGRHGGRVDHVIPRVGAAIDGRPALLLLHHHLLPIPFQTNWPPGVPSTSARRLIRAVAEAAPAAAVVSGHSHRHRMHRVGDVVVAETGSPKDHPGTWTGYVVHEGGLRQVVRRVARPDVIRWTERSGRAAGGAWRHWSPGTLDQRCWNLLWP